MSVALPVGRVKGALVSAIYLRQCSKGPSRPRTHPATALLRGSSIPAWVGRFATLRACPPRRASRNPLLPPSTGNEQRRSRISIREREAGNGEGTVRKWDLGSCRGAG